MKVLFVCHGNVSRSQRAMTMFNELSKKHSSTSAGTHVGEKEGYLLHEDVINSMKEIGYDLSQNRRKQLTKEMVEKADKIIVMAAKEDWPDYLKNSKKVTFWKVDDDKGQNYEFARKVARQVKKKVEELVKEIG